MKIILLLIETIFIKIFRWDYLRKKKNFLLSFLHFLNLDSILSIFKKKMTVIGDIFLNLGTPKNVVR